MKDCIKWKSLDQGFTKLNFDGSVVNNQSASISFIIRDEEECPVFADTRKVMAYHVPITKAVALQEGLCAAIRQNFLKVQVEGDSKIIIDCVFNKCFVPWQLKLIIKDI